MGRSELRRVLEAVDGLVLARGPDDAAAAVLAAVVSSVGADSAVVSRLDRRGATVWTWPGDFLDESQQRTFEAVNALHPWPLAAHTRQGSGSCLRISDLWTPRQYRSTAMYAELFKVLSVRHQVALSIPTVAGHAICVALQRSRRDFTTGECRVLDALRSPLAMAADRSSPPTSATAAGPGNLSVRELDVLRLVATGQSDAQVGRRLGISTHTVSKHLQHVYRKLGVTNRTQASEWAHGATTRPVDAFCH